jgi:pyridoxine/pyridoxamine 5'-phosphate oxidase
MRKRKLTKLRLLAELRKRLSRPDTRVKLRRQTVCGQSTWMEETNNLTTSIVITDVMIFLDPRRDGRVRLVIHELLHVWMGEHFRLHDRMVYELEEKAIRGWEELLYARLHSPKHAKELDNWDRAIQRKIASS